MRGVNVTRVHVGPGGFTGRLAARLVALDLGVVVVGDVYGFSTVAYSHSLNSNVKSGSAPKTPPRAAK